jgi:hypothetical protein
MPQKDTLYGDLFVVGNFEANLIKKTGGTSSEFLKADGSVDSTAYLTITPTLAQVTTAGNTTTNAITVAKITTNGSITAASLLARGVFFNNTLVAAANNDVLVGLDINPTFTNGAFTGVSNHALRIQNYLTNSSQVRIGGLEIQSYSLNNTWFGDNVYYDGTNFRVRQTGTTGMFYYYTNEGQFRLTASQTAGSIVPSTNIVQLKINSDGTFAVGSGMSAVPGNYTNAKFVVFGSTGNAAINSITDAGYKLDVNGTGRFTNNLLIVGGATGNPLDVKNSSSSSIFRIISNKDIIFEDYGQIYFYKATNILSTYGIGSDFNIRSGGDLNALWIKSNGNILVGTSTDSGYRLDVSGQTIVRDMLTLRGYTGGTVGSAVAGYTKSLLIGGTYNQGYNSGNAVILHIADYSNDGADNVYPIYCEDENNVVDFWINSGNTGDSTSKKAYFGGNVGIGITNPTNKLQVVGNIALSGNLVPTSGTSTVGTFANRFTDFWGSGLIVGSTFYGDNYQTASGTMFFKDGGGVERMRMTSVGNFLIGTTTDSGQKLQVIGSVFIKGTDSLSSTKVFEVQNGAGASIMDFRNATYAFFGCGQGGGSNSGFIFNYSNTSYTQFAGYNYGAGAGSYKPILMDTDTGGRNQGIFVNFGVTTNTPPNSDTEFGVLGRTSDSTTYISRFRNSGNTDKFAIRADGALFTNTLQGYSGTLNIPTNPPGTSNITITNGLITNIA